jgi:hypothetical protein
VTTIIAGKLAKGPQLTLTIPLSCSLFDEDGLVLFFSLIEEIHDK